MKNLNLTMALVGGLMASAALGQTNPAPHNLAGANFTFTGFSDSESTTYPASTQGWAFGQEPEAASVEPASNDRVLVGLSASATAGNMRNEGENGISFLNSASNHIGAFAVSLNTIGRENLTATFTAQDIRDGESRQNGLVLQYRIGESGDFTSVAGTTYLSDPVGLAPAQTFTDIALPSDANNQPVVQLRWMYYWADGGGFRDRVRLDDITIASDASAGGTGVDVTFRVDMSEFTGTIQPEGMHIAGSFPTNTWDPATRPMNNEGNGIWSWTENLEPDFALEYKFVLGPGWAFGDENMGGQPCGAAGTTNRALIVPSQDTELPAVCYNSCSPCNVVPETSAITFQVDMSQETIAPEGVGISGGFNDFTFEPMVSQGNGIYAITLDLAQGVTYEYKFRNGEEFESPPLPCGTGGFNNRLVTVTTNDEILEVQCYSACGPCSDPGETFQLTFNVDASQIEVDALGLHIAGNFNGFTPAPMVNAGGGIYTFSAQVLAGAQVLWKYLNGNSFDGAEVVPSECGMDDGFDGFNRDLEAMPASDLVLDAVCFASCTACVPDFVRNVGQREHLTLYPNPNRGEWLMVAPANGTAQLRVYDVGGRLVHANTVSTTAGDNITYNQAILNAGFYIVELRYGAHTYTTRMAVE